MQRIEADVLIPGRGDPIRNGCVVIEEATIAYAGPIEGAPEGGETTSVPAVMPGLWDAHGHFYGILTANVEVVAKTPLPVMSARTVMDAERGLMAGFTSVREPGGLGLYLARVVDEGSAPGPHIYAAGAALSPTGGHGDLHMYPLDLMHILAERGFHSTLCDGVPECLRAVRTQLRRGAKVIKIMASGGVMSELDHPVHQQFSDEEQRAIVEEAGRAERVVAAHCHGKPGILAALRAGCRTIEHGSFLDEEAADLMIEKGAILVPTRLILESLVAFAEEAGVPDYAQRKARFVAESHGKALRTAIRKGVRIAVGTDIFFSGAGSPVSWGMNANELVHLVDAGMTTLQAIEAATATGPETLGPQAPKSGRLEAGYDADVLAVAKDPMSNVRVLTDARNITSVWKSGRLVKGSGS